MKEIPKGSIGWLDGWWYVVLAIKDSSVYCICDNANNRYVWDLPYFKYFATPYEAIRANNWSQGEDELMELIRERSVPVDVIAEVLSGCHDYRFDDYGIDPTAQQIEGTDK